MKTDKLFYRLFLSQPNLIAELIPEIPSGCEFAYGAEKAGSRKKLKSAAGNKI